MIVYVVLYDEDVIGFANVLGVGYKLNSNEK